MLTFKQRLDCDFCDHVEEVVTSRLTLPPDWQQLPDGRLACPNCEVTMVPEVKRKETAKSSDGEKASVD